MRKHIILSILLAALLSLFISCDNEKGIFTQISEDERPIELRILDIVETDTSYVYLTTGGICDDTDEIRLENSKDRIAHQIAYCDSTFYVLYSTGEVCSYDTSFSSETVLATDMNMLTRKGHYFKASGLPVMPLESNGKILACDSNHWYVIDDIPNGVTLNASYLSGLTPERETIKTPLSFISTQDGDFATDNSKLYRLNSQVGTSLPSGLGNSKAVAFTVDSKLYFLSLAGSSNIYEFKQVSDSFEKNTLILKRTDGPTVSIQPVSIFQSADSALVATLKNGLFRLVLSDGEIRAQAL